MRYQTTAVQLIVLVLYIFSQQFVLDLSTLRSASRRQMSKGLHRQQAECRSVGGIVVLGIIGGAVLCVVFLSVFISLPAVVPITLLGRYCNFLDVQTLRHVGVVL